MDGAYCKQIPVTIVTFPPVYFGPRRVGNQTPIRREANPIRFSLVSALVDAWQMASGGDCAPYFFFWFTATFCIQHIYIFSFVCPAAWANLD